MGRRRTTNGTLLPQRASLLCQSPAVRKVSVSLHSFEGNEEQGQLLPYLDSCIAFARRAAQAGKRCALRLWNLDGEHTQGANSCNEQILRRLEETFPRPWKEGWQGTTLAPRVYLEWGERFEWPDLNADDHKRLVQDIQTTYAALNGYQRKLLSANELKRLDEVAKINADELKAVAEVTVKVTVEGTLPSWYGTGGNAYRGWPCLTWSDTPNPDGSVPTPSWATLPQTSQGATLTNVKAGDLVFIRRYMPNHTDEKYWLVWSADNGQTWESTVTTTWPAAPLQRMWPTAAP